MKNIKSILIIIVAFSGTILAQVEPKIAFGPYVQNMGTRSAIICWSTLEGSSKLIGPDSSVKIINEYKQHRIRLGRLEADTEYSYDVLDNGTDEGKGKFKTFPNTNTSFKFAILGDTRSRHNIHSRIVNRIIEKHPLFIVNTGDLVGNGLEISDWEAFFKVNRELMRNTPYYPVLGNHEKDSPYYFDFFDLPNNERQYYFSVGDALFIFLDSEGEQLSKPNFVSDKNSDKFWQDAFEEHFVNQKNWLEKVLDLHKEAGFIFVFQHKPLFSIKKSRVEDSNIYRAFWGDIFERHNVQAVINGHDHHYHHAMKNDVHYITTAGGGAGLYETDSPHPETITFNKIEHFIQATINSKDAVLNIIDIDGNEIDKIIISRREQNK